MMPIFLITLELSSEIFKLLSCEIVIDIGFEYLKIEPPDPLELAVKLL